jgi:hypothetical protein
MRPKAIRGRDEALVDVQALPGGGDHHRSAGLPERGMVRGAAAQRNTRLIPQRLQWLCVLMEILPVRVHV